MGIVFGEQGTTLGRISKETKCRLQMPEKGTNNLQIAVTGEERDVEHAFSLIQELLEQGYTKTTHPDWVSEEVQVGEAVGIIIGKDGANVRRISHEHKVKIDTPKRDDPNAKQDTVYVRGPPRNVAKAKRDILNTLASREAPIEHEIPDPAWQGEVQEPDW